MDAPAHSILVVDDDAANRLALEEILKPMGVRAVMAGSGEEALKRVLEDDFAAILMDVRMPGIDGFTTASMIRERNRSRNTPIIFMTSALEDLGAMFKGVLAKFLGRPVGKPALPREAAAAEAWVGMSWSDTMSE